MRGRGTLQANDLLDIVDFIKHEDQYTARINELKAHEAALAEKMGIVRSLEQANAMQEKAVLIEQKLAQDRIAFTQEMEDLKMLQKKEHQERMNLILKRESELRHMKEDLNTANEILHNAQDELGQAQRKFQVEQEALSKQFVMLEQHELKWKNKLIRLQQVMESQ